MRIRILLVSAVLCFTGGLVAADSRPIVLADGQGAEAPKQPQAFVSGDATVDIVWAEGETIRLTTSKDAGKSFTPAPGIISCRNLSAGMRRGPRVVRTNNRVVVTGIGGQLGKGKDGDLFAWSSDDEGISWSSPIMINETAGSAREGLHGMAAAPDGTVYAVWLDLREQRSQVWLAKSTDGGTVWSKNLRVYQSPDGSVCECCHPSVAAAGDSVVVMFRNSLGGNRDMFATTSKDQGASFEPAVKLGAGTWTLDACPMDGGMLAIDPAGSLVTVWRRNREVFTLVGSAKEETLVGRGEQPWLAATADGPVVVWTTGREGDLMLQKPGQRKPVQLANAARNPVVSSAASGQGPVVVCWESLNNGHSSVMAQRAD